MSQIESFDDCHAITLIGTGPGVSNRVLKLGEVIGGSYKLKSLLGKGGMGYVFCAEHTIIQRDYALKIIAPEQLNEDSRRRFETEGRAIANLDHPNIVKVHNMGLDAGNCPFYVMDRLDGRALSDCISARQDIDLQECLDIFSQIASGLGYAHSKGIVHRDVKPSNIILLPDGQGRYRVKIVDFGIAKLLPSANLQSQSQTATGEVFGSPSYMSPEQCIGAPVDHRSDIYSLGCTLFETLCGQPPYRADNIIATLLMHQKEPVPSILEERPGQHWPQSLDLLLTKMMAKRAEDRYQSMEQLIHDLERIKQGKAIGKLPGTGPAEDAPAYAPGFADGGGGARIKGMSANPATSGSKGAKAPTIVISLLVLVLSLGGGWLWLRAGNQPMANQPIRPPVASPEVALDSDLERARRMAKNCLAIKSEIVTKEGVRQKRFVFPEFIIGTVWAPGFPRVEACGVQYLPINQPLILEIGKGASLQVIHVPEIIDKIDPSEFSSLMLNLDQMGGAGGADYMQGEAVDFILRAASRWSKLSFLQLSQCSVSKGQLDLINGFMHLRYFFVDHSTIDTADLANQPFLKRLLVLELDQTDPINSIQPVCEKLGSCPMIATVHFGHCDTSPQDLRELRRCPQLRTLELEEKNFDPLVPVVPQLTTLREVRFINAHLSQEQIKIITSCSNLRHLRLRQKSYVDRERAYYGHSEPKVLFEDY